jgi:hypothetical protein
MGNAEIARRQGVSAEAVKFHVANILQKLGFSRRADIRRWHRGAAGKHLERDDGRPLEITAQVNAS